MLESELRRQALEALELETADGRPIVYLGPNHNGVEPSMRSAFCPLLRYGVARAATADINSDVEGLKQDFEHLVEDNAHFFSLHSGELEDFARECRLSTQRAVEILRAARETPGYFEYRLASHEESGRLSWLNKFWSVPLPD